MGIRGSEPASRFRCIRHSDGRARKANSRPGQHVETIAGGLCPLTATVFLRALKLTQGFPSLPLYSVCLLIGGAASLAIERAARARGDGWSHCTERK